MRLPAGTGPAAFNGLKDNGNFAVYGLVAPDVAVIKVQLSNGHTMTVRPVRVGDSQMAGFAVPASGETVESATAYTATGQATATGVPYEDRTALIFDMWQRPGQRGLPRASAMLASGPGWRVIAHAGPWGVCLQVPVPAGSEGACWTLSPSSASPSSTGIAGEMAIQPSQRLLFGQASSSTTHLVATWKDGAVERIPVIPLGSIRIFAIPIPPRAAGGTWAGYNSSGHQTSSGQLTP
jgi:hypothetical protein